jgi:sugar phosphate isomerase/epimerase
MNIGIFAKIFKRATLEETLDAIQAHGIHAVQFNMCCAGLPTLPEHIDSVTAQRIHHAMDERGLTMVAISGTYNMIHPDPVARADGLHRLGVMAQACRTLGTPIITLCTGTRDAANMWRRHPENDTPDAWHDLLTVMRSAATMAEQAGVNLGIEPELSNVVDSAEKARSLLDEIGSSSLKIVMDGSNLLRAPDIPRMRDIFQQAFELLGKDVAVVHAKDLVIDGSADHGAAGTGVLDYDAYLALLKRIGFTGPLILHTLEENQVDESVAFLRGKLIEGAHSHAVL